MKIQQSCGSASNKTPVYYEGVMARIIVTVSFHNVELFHQFRKNAKMLYMPCPSELHILLMGQIHQRSAKELEHCLTDAEIHQCVKRFHLFQFLCTKDEEDV